MNKKNLYWIILVLVLTIPTFVRMVRPGIFSMQDFPYFRVVEYSKCFADLQMPCRWAPDAGLMFGEPVFNFYSHVPFFISGALVQLGVGAINSLKIVFILSFAASSISMYFLSKKVWKNNWSALASSILYLYAPYRAVDVWVRAALPEAFAFVLLPLILLFFENYLSSLKKRWLAWLTISLALLILTHNLSVILFAHAIGAWIIVRLTQERKWKNAPMLFFASIASVALSAFYLLPAIFESQFVNLKTTTIGYFDFRAHFVTIHQLFLSRLWGYGGSTWGNEDRLSMSVGQVQWIAVLLVLLFVVYRYYKTRKFNSSAVIALHLSLTSIFYLFMTHNKSTFLWETLDPVMKYIQFPWRFLGVALFSISLAVGYLATVHKKYAYLIAGAVCLFAILLNVNFFREDLWFNVNDTDMQTGERWVEQTRASIGDYWPTFGPIPTAQFSGDGVSLVKSTSSSYEFVVTNNENEIELPVAFFPGWVAYSGTTQLKVNPSKNGLINVKTSIDSNKIYLKFTNTSVRVLGNLISIISIIGLTIFMKRENYLQNVKK